MIRDKKWYKKIILGLCVAISLGLITRRSPFAKVVNEPKIILDMAHHDTKNDKGAMFDIYNERDIVNAITEKVGDILVKEGFIVVYTRKIGETISIKDRVNFAKNNDYYLYLSIHANSNDNSKPGTGSEAYSNNKWSLSDDILNDFENELGLVKRKSPEATPYYNRNIPNSLLLELGFINNVTDRDILLNKQDIIAQIIAKNIMLDYNKNRVSERDKTVIKELKMFDGSVVPVKVVYY